MPEDMPKPKKPKPEKDLYAKSTNLRSVLENGEEYEAD